MISALGKVWGSGLRVSGLGLGVGSNLRVGGCGVLIVQALLD